MDKGVLSQLTEEALLKMIIDALADQKPIVRLGASLGFKLITLYGDNIMAEKLPESLKVKARAFLDAIFVAKDYDLAINLGVELIPELFDLLNNKTPMVALLAQPITAVPIPPVPPVTAPIKHGVAA